MFLLAFESSCDDTSVALLRDDVLISMHTHTQLEHIQTLGVVPEVAARLHADHIFDLITEVLTDAWIELSAIDVFAATSEPGLVPSLLIGKTVAKSLAISHKKPIIWVNHIEGHIFSLLLERKLEELEFPMVVLSASGWHNDLFLWNSLYEIEKVGSTVDDSAGESMDKVGRSLWLSFPAGRYIDELAQKYDPEIHKNIPSFPLVLPEWSLNFSFSGLKSAALREIQLRASLNLSKGETSNLLSSEENYLEPEYLTANKALYSYVLEYQKILKQNPTATEWILWEYLKTKKIGHKMRRQHIIGGFIADFVCIRAKTVIEIDGRVHDFQKEYDEMRTRFLQEIGFEVIRFTNDEVLEKPEIVVEKIKEYLDNRINLLDWNGNQNSPLRGVGGASEVLGLTDLIEISYGYQEIITEILSKRLIEAFEKSPSFGGVGEAAKSIGIVGGVSANSALRKIMEKYSRENNIPYYTPKSLKYCGDNAAMIGVRAYYLHYYWNTK
jgi:N6-L-threonylcarbamoyladenine synthase